MSARAQSLRETLDRVANSLAASDLQLERAHSDSGLLPQPHPARSTMEVIDRVLWVRGTRQPDAHAARCGTGCISKLSPLVRAVEACSPPCVHADLDGARPPSPMSLPNEYLAHHTGLRDAAVDSAASPTIVGTATSVLPPSAVDAAIKSMIEGQHCGDGPGEGGRAGGAERILKSVLKRAVPRVSSAPAALPAVAHVAWSEEGGEGGEGATSEGASTPPSPFSSPIGSRPSSPTPARRKVSFADEGDKPAPLTYTRYIASRAELAAESAADVAAAAFAAVGGSMPSFYKKMLSKLQEDGQQDDAWPPQESERGSSTRDTPPEPPAAADSERDDETKDGQDVLEAVTPAKTQPPAGGTGAAGSSHVASPPSSSLSPPMSPTALRHRFFGAASSAGSLATSPSPSSSVAAPAVISVSARVAAPEAAAPAAAAPPAAAPPVAAPAAATSAAPDAAPVVAPTEAESAQASAAAVPATASFSQKLAAQSAALERTVTLPSFYKRMLSRLQEAEPAADATSELCSGLPTSTHAMPTTPGWLPAPNRTSSAATTRLPTAANVSQTKLVTCDIAGGELL